MKAILASPGGGHRPLKRTREESDLKRRRAPNQRENFQNANPNMRKAEPREQQPSRGVINMISGGPTDGDSNRARKASSRRLENMEISSPRTRSGPMISFGPEDMKGVADPHNDALVIRAMIANYEVARIFVDSGSSVNVLFKEAMDQMDLGDYTVEPISTALFGFTGHAILPLGVVNLPLSLGSGDTRKTMIINFVILERPAMAAFMAIASALHQKIKFPVGEAVGDVRGDQKISQKCYVEEVRVEQKSAKIEHTSRPESRGFDQLHLIEEAEEVTSKDVCEELILNPPSGVVRIAQTLEEPLKEQLVRCLEKNKDVFAWCPSKLQGVRREVMEHKMNVLNECRPVIQKKRHFGPENDAIIKEQMQDLLRVGHIQEIYFPTWLSNVVLVPKSAEKWRMKRAPLFSRCISRISPNSLGGKGQKQGQFYHIRGDILLCSNAFWIKNDGATYQRLMDKVFKKQIGKNVEVYVDNISIKSKIVDQFVMDLEETFQTLREYRLKLNPSKCVFEVQTGKFLGYMVTRRGIEANPEKVLRKAKNFEWNDQSEKALQELKTYLRELPILNKLVPGEELLVYLAVTPQAASSVLVRREDAVHQPVYFEKLALALVIMARKLRSYFLSHPIIVLTNSVLGKIVSHPDTSGRLIKWVTELSEYDIKFEPRTAIKAQALADFLAETVQVSDEEQWKIFVDGSSCRTRSGVGIVIISPWREDTKVAVRLNFRASNNEAEYGALLVGLRAARSMGVKTSQS
ncbi:uncharacterized protein [Primulina huaijiensis]|uniref:uncharacterized protein n=1 Tax=Primulina huaijiensis TaxID=1492673 RepID=UPI003CC779AC